MFNKLFKECHSVTLQVGLELSSNTATGSRNTRYGYLRYRGETFAAVPTTYTTAYNSIAQANPLLDEMRTASVSYTHLDVYKRQTRGYASPGIQSHAR